MKQKKLKKLKKRLKALESQVESLLIRTTALRLANTCAEHRRTWSNTRVDALQTICTDNRASLILLAEGLEPFVYNQLDEPEPDPDEENDVHI